MPLTAHMSTGDKISELMHSWKRKGSIGTSGKIPKKKAQQMAIAIAMSHSRKKGSKKHKR